MGKLSWIKDSLKRATYTKMRDIAEKRIKRAKQAGIGGKLIKDNIQGFKKLRDMTDAKEFRKEYQKLQKFVNSDMTKVSTHNKVYENVYHKLTHDYEIKNRDGTTTTIKAMFTPEQLSYDEMRAYGDFMDMVRQTEDEHNIGSPEAAKLFLALYSDQKKKPTREQFMKDASAALYKFSDNKKRAKAAFKEMESKYDFKRGRMNGRIKDAINKRFGIS